MPRIKNVTRHTVISENLTRAKGFLNKSIGLMGSEGNSSLLIETRYGIHTFGIKTPLDVLILNQENRVAKVKENLMPRRIFLWNIRHKKVLELPIRSITKAGPR